MYLCSGEGAVLIVWRMYSTDLTIFYSTYSSNGMYWRDNVEGEIDDMLQALAHVYLVLTCYVLSLGGDMGTK